MVTPKKAQIMKRAKEHFFRRISVTGLPFITPEEHELKESGAFAGAQRDLMRSESTVARMEQLKYVDSVAGELGLRVIPKKELRVLKRKTGFEWTDGWTEHKKRERKVKTPKKPKPRPTKKRRVERVGKSMRKLRKVKGVKVFSFPDHVWKVRKK